MKRTIAVVLGVCLLLGAFPFAVAEGEPEGNIIAEVETLAELKEAVSIAKDGDTIAISSGIVIWTDDVVETDKNITLIRHEDCMQYPMLYLGENAVLRGFTIIDTSKWPDTVDMLHASSVQDCNFVGNPDHYGDFISLTKAETEREENPTIKNCSFVSNYSSAIDCGPNTTVLIENCSFNDIGNTAVYNNAGSVEMVDCTITNCGKGLYSNPGTATLSGCHIKNNGLLLQERCDLEVTTLSITDKQKDNEGYYNVKTGEKIDLPYNKDEVMWLIYLTDEEAETYFEEPEPTPPEEPEPIPTPTPVSPTPTPTPTITPEPTPEPTPSIEPIPTPTPSQPTYDPSDDDDDDEEERVPPAVHRPTHTTSKPKQPPELPKEVLRCGGAKIDPTRSAELFGDKDDPLTRAEMARLIYSLMENSTPGPEESISSTFRDVPQNVWYAPYVLYLADIGAVVGVGGDCYAPEGETTWGQLLTLLGRFMELRRHEIKDIRCEEWERPAIENVLSREWIEDEANFSPGAVVTHGEAVSFINRILKEFR